MSNLKLNVYYYIEKKKKFELDCIEFIVQHNQPASTLDDFVEFVKKYSQIP